MSALVLIVSFFEVSESSGTCIGPPFRFDNSDFVLAFGFGTSSLYDDYCISWSPLAMDHHGSVTYVRYALSGADMARRPSFHRW